MPQTHIYAPLDFPDIILQFRRELALQVNRSFTVSQPRELVRLQVGEATADGGGDLLCFGGHGWDVVERERATRERAEVLQLMLL